MLDARVERVISEVVSIIILASISATINIGVCRVEVAEVQVEIAIGARVGVESKSKEKSSVSNLGGGGGGCPGWVGSQEVDISVSCKEASSTTTDAALSRHCFQGMHTYLGNGFLRTTRALPIC